MVEDPLGIPPRVLLLGLEVGGFPYTSNSISILSHCPVYTIVLSNTLFEILAITMREEIIEGKREMKKSHHSSLQMYVSTLIRIPDTIRKLILCLINMSS